MVSGESRITLPFYRREFRFDKFSGRAKTVLDKPVDQIWESGNPLRLL